LSDAKVDKIKEVANKISTDSGFLTALQLSEKRKSIFKLCTGSQELKSLFILIFLFI
jgi:meiotic recombination protein DMC1